MKYEDFLGLTQVSKAELIGISQGNLVSDAPAEFIRLPAPPFLMLDRVTSVERGKGRGRICGERDVNLDDWFFQCHFRDDPVQPGCLGVDAVWQLLGLYCALAGGVGSGRALGCKEVDFFGQIRPHNRVIRYEVEVRRFSLLKGSGSSISIGSAKVIVDGEHIYNVSDAKVGLFLGIAYRGYPEATQNHMGGVMERG